jgi:TldD protein
VHTGARTALLIGLAGLVYGQPAVLLDVMASELDRNFQVLKEKSDPPAYYLSYAITEQDYSIISASFGAVTAHDQGRSRTLDVSVRVGSPKLDNYHRVRGDRARFTSGAPLTVDDEPGAIRRRIWLDTDRAWRAATERLVKIRTGTQVRVAEEDESDDFSQEDPQVHLQDRQPAVFRASEWEPRLRDLSKRFGRYPGVLTADVTVVWQDETRYFTDSAGSRLRHGRGYARVVISARGKAADGMDLGTGATFEAADPARLPSQAELAKAVDRVAQDLEALLKAPVSDPYVGPAIFSGRAAGVFFHEIFGHRVEGHRQKDESEGQTFTRGVGTRVLPEFLSVTFDPTRRDAAGTDLNGWYLYDDEGVAARPVQVVEDGVLKTFLMSRSPVRGFDRSNGHGRRQPGYEVVARQSNLLVESSRTVPEKRLRELLIEEVKRQGKPYGLYFRDVTGGFTQTARGGVQAFKVLPVLVYRVYPDGRPDELVRGADIVGTPLASFGKILATSDRTEVFNGYCGAESGRVPVAAVAPALLVSEIEIEKRASAQDRPPLLPPPGGAR